MEEITRDIILLCGILLHFFSSSLILFLKGFGFYMNYIHWWNQAEKKDACICVMCMSFVSSTGKNIGQSGKYHNILWTAIWVVLHVKYNYFVLYMKCMWNVCKFMQSWCIACANCAKKKRYCKCLVYKEHQANEILNIKLCYILLWPIISFMVRKKNPK